MDEAPANTVGQPSSRTPMFSLLPTASNRNDDDDDDDDGDNDGDDGDNHDPCCHNIISDITMKILTMIPFLV